MTADLACKAQISTFSHGREVEGGGGGGGGGEGGEGREGGVGEGGRGRQLLSRK